MPDQKMGKPNIFKSFLIAIVILLIIGAIKSGLEFVKLPVWPTFFFLFYFSTVLNMAKEKLWVTAIGGFIGMTAGFSEGLVTMLTGNETVGLAVFLVILIAFLTAIVDGRVRVVEPFCLMVLTCLTNPVGFVASEDGLLSYVTGHAGFDVSIGMEATPKDYTLFKYYALCTASYAIAVSAFALITFVMNRKSQSTKKTP